MQQAQGIALHDGALRSPGFFPRALVTGGDDCIDGGVHRFDAMDAGLEQLDRRELPGSDQAPRFEG